MRRSDGTLLHWCIQWFTVLFLGVTLVLGGAYRVYKARTTVAEEAPAYA